MFKSLTSKFLLSLKNAAKLTPFLVVLLVALTFGGCGLFGTETGVQNTSEPASAPVPTAAPRMKFIGPYNLKSEFDLCPYWDPSMTWSKFQEIRTFMTRPELMKYVNKIAANKMLKDKGFPVVPILYSSHSKNAFVDQISGLRSYVAKPSHMSANHGLVIVKDGIDVTTGDRISPEEVQEKMFKVLDTPSNSNEWLLQNMPRGFLIEEYIAGRNEIKIQTVWGKAVLGTWLQGETMNYQFYDLDGNPTDPSYDPLPFKNAWKKAIDLAEAVAEGTDALRVDILVKYGPDSSEEPELLINEMELRQQLGWVNHEGDFVRLINAGYTGNCLLVP